MKTSFLLMPILVVMSGCASSPWVTIGSSKDFTYYVHSHPRVNTFGRPVTTEVLDFKKEQTALYDLKKEQGDNSFQFNSVLAQGEYDCYGSQRRFNYIHAYSKNMGEGELVYRRKERTQWMAVTLGMADGNVLEAVCTAKAPEKDNTTQNNNNFLLYYLLWSSLYNHGH